MISNSAFGSVRSYFERIVRVGAERVGIGRAVILPERRDRARPAAKAPGSGLNGTESIALSRTPIFRPRRLGANPFDDFAQEARAVLQAAAISAGPVDRAQEFVAEIAVTMLDVDEIVTALPRRASRRRCNHRSAA